MRPPPPNTLARVRAIAETARVVREVRAARLKRVPPVVLGAGCTAKTQRCGDAKSYHAELRPCCRNHIRQIVSDTAALLAEYGVTWWADYGTLLGAVRNPLTTWKDYPWLPQEGRPEGPLAPGIIPHDKDADTGFLASDWTKLMRVRKALERKGYRVKTGPFGLKMKVRLSITNSTNLDLFGWRERVGGVLFRPTYINVDHYKGRDFKKADGFPLTTVEWEGMQVPAPKNPEAFCAFRYGPNWRTPIAANHDGVRR
jgi:hypothetical protein